MRLVDRGLLAPGICVVCEQNPEETEFVDTLRDFDTGTVTHLTGRKYVCGNCVRQMGALLGLVPEEKLHAAQDFLAASEVRHNRFVEAIHAALSEAS